MPFIQMTIAEHNEREQRKIRWNGKQKYGSYEAYDAELLRRKQQRDQERQATQMALDAGDFIPVKHRGKKKNKSKAMTSECFTAKKTLFSAFNDVGNDDVAAAPVAPAAPVAAAPVLGTKRSYATAMKEGPSVQQEIFAAKKALQLPSVVSASVGPVFPEKPKSRDCWFDMCDSDDED